jgi:hypothetical protein
VILLWALQAGVEIRGVEPVTPFYKKGAWTCVVVVAETDGPFQGSLVARADSAVTFERPVRFESAGSHRRTLPVYFLTEFAKLSVWAESGGGSSARRDLPAGSFQCLKSMDVIVLASPETWPKDERWELGPQQVVGTRFDMRKVELWGGEALECVDVLVDLGGSEGGLFPWRSMGGRLLRAAEFRPQEAAPRAFISPLDPPRLQGPFRSRIRRDCAALFFLIYASAMLAFWILVAVRKPGPRFVAAGAVLLVASASVGFAAALPGSPVVVIERPIEASRGESAARLRLIAASSPRELTVSIPLAWMSKVLSDVEARLVIDADARTTTAVGIRLAADAPVGFAGIQSQPEAPYPLAAEGSILRNGGAALERAFYFDGKSVSTPRPIGPGGQTVVGELTNQSVLAETDRWLLKWFGREGRFVCGAASGEPSIGRIRSAVERTALEWQTLPLSYVRRID